MTTQQKREVNFCRVCSLPLSAAVEVSVFVLRVLSELSLLLLGQESAGTEESHEAYAKDRKKEQEERSQIINVFNSTLFPRYVWLWIGGTIINTWVIIRIICVSKMLMIYSVFVFWASHQSCARCQVQHSDRRLPWWMLKHQTWCSLWRLETHTCIFHKFAPWHHIGKKKCTLLVFCFPLSFTSPGLIYTIFCVSFCVFFQMFSSCVLPFALL